MDRQQEEDKDSRHSSLPSSLIPHLYSRPQRNLLGEDIPEASAVEEPVRPQEMIYAPPLVSSNSYPLRSQPAHGSITHDAYSQTDSMGRYGRGSGNLPPSVPIIRQPDPHRYAGQSQAEPLRLPHHRPAYNPSAHGQQYPSQMSQHTPESWTMENEAGPSYQYPPVAGSWRTSMRSSAPHETYEESMQYGQHVPIPPPRQFRSYQSDFPEYGAMPTNPYPPTFPARQLPQPSSSSYPPHLGREIGYYDYQSRGSHDTRQLPSRGGSSQSTGYGGSRSSEGGDLHPYLPTGRSGGSEYDYEFDFEDDNNHGISNRGQKRPSPADFADEDTGPKKRKAEVACDFCRGRKLRCDGARPACSNCASRKQACVYESMIPRRRGPGKAPKGSKKRAKSQQSSRNSPSEGNTSNDPEQRNHPSRSNLRMASNSRDTMLPSALSNANLSEGSSGSRIGSASSRRASSRAARPSTRRRSRRDDDEYDNDNDGDDGEYKEARKRQ